MAWRKMVKFNIEPVSKPRMTRSDKWKTRPATSAYWTFKDDLKLAVKKADFEMPESDYHLKFYLPMPKSWSKKKRAEMLGMPHQQKPDKDNLEKAFLDALCKDDSHIWDGRVSKYWAEKGHIVIEYDVDLELWAEVEAINVIK